MGKSGKNVGLELVCVSKSDAHDPTQIRIASIDTMKAYSAGLDDITLEKHQRLQALLSRAIPPADAPLGRTTRAEHKIKSTYPGAVIRDLEEIEINKPSASPWASPVVMAPKYGNKHRMVIDMRKVNAAAKGDAYPLPNMDQIHAQALCVPRHIHLESEQCLP